jgi:hypothetical protein
MLKTGPDGINFTPEPIIYPANGVFLEFRTMQFWQAFKAI